MEMSMWEKRVTAADEKLRTLQSKKKSYDGIEFRIIHKAFSHYA